MKKVLLLLAFLVSIASAGFLDSVVKTVSDTASSMQGNQPLINEVKKQTGLSTTQSTGAIGTLLGYAGNNLSSSDYSSITNKVPELKSITSNPTISPLISTLTSSDMVQSTLKGMGVDPSLVQTIIPIVVNYVSQNGGQSSGNMLSNALSGLIQ